MHILSIALFWLVFVPLGRIRALLGAPAFPAYATARKKGTWTIRKSLSPGSCLSKDEPTGPAGLVALSLQRRGIFAAFLALMCLPITLFSKTPIDDTDEKPDIERPHYTMH